MAERCIFPLDNQRIVCRSVAVNQIARYADHVRPVNGQRIHNDLVRPVVQISKQGDAHVDRCVKVVYRFSQ